jgi:hypothetical protein
MDPKRWQELFIEYKQSREQKHKREESDRAMIAWYDEQTKLVMGLVREVALERAHTFEEATGQKVEVEWPSRPPINVDPEGPFMSFMSVSLGRREVHLYSHRLQANPPAIHFVVTGDKDVVFSERKRVIGRPGCRIEKRAGGGFLLRDASDSRNERREISADDVAYKAFELLLAQE